jgi:hypothetical protein
MLRHHWVDEICADHNAKVAARARVDTRRLPGSALRVDG